MIVPTIHCHSQIDKSTVGFLKFMWETMLAMANHPESLKITVHCMSQAAADRVGTWLVRGETKVVPDKRGEPLNGSYGHAACIMSALSMTGNGEIHVIADSDTVVVAKGWDDYIRNRLVNDGVGMIGTTYEDLGGFSSGKDKVQAYKKSPTFTWCALSPTHNWQDLSVWPDKGKQIAIDSELLSQIYGLPQGYSVFGEAGYQLPQYLHDNSLNCEGWRQLKPSKEGVVLKGLSDYHEEYHAADVPIVVHHRGSMRHRYREDRISRHFYKSVDDYLAEEQKRSEGRWTWSDNGKVLVPVSVKSQPNVPPGPKAQVAPSEYVPRGKEWIKVSFNGKVIVPRTTIDRKSPSKELSLKRPNVDAVGHVRVEGVLEHDYPIVLPPIVTEPYMVTLRNMSGAPLYVNCGKGAPVEVPNWKTYWLIVDVDSVQRVE